METSRLICSVNPLIGFDITETLTLNGLFHNPSRVSLILTFKRQFHKMVKHTQTIRRQIADELFECV